MFDIGISHLVVMAIVGILVLGPEKLPGFARDAVRMWRTLRGLASDAQARITGELLPEVSEEVRALPPRELAKHLLLGDDDDQPASARAGQHGEALRTGKGITVSTVEGSERDLDPVAAAGRMAILDHLRELRRRLAIIVVIVAVGTVAGYFLYQPVLAVLEKPFCAVDPSYRFGGEAGRCVLVFSGVLDGFTTRLKIAAVTGAVLTAPLWLYQLWAFVTPGLRKAERRYTVAFVLSSSLLLIAGAFVAYEILAKGLSMLLSQGGGDVEAMLTVTSYLSFVMLTLVVFGLSFELPLLIVIANLAGVLPSATLRKSQRIAIFLIFVFAGIVVPSTDPFSMCAMAIPMVLLYEAAVGIATLHDRSQARRATSRHSVEDLDDQTVAAVEPAQPVTVSR